MGRGHGVPVVASARLAPKLTFHLPVIVTICNHRHNSWENANSLHVRQFFIIIPSMRTPQYKQEILQHFADCHLLSIKDLEAKVPSADYSTLFRNVTALVESGDLKRVVVDKNRVLYERGDHAHDHFVCDFCGAVDAVHIARNQLGVRHPIHDILVRGVCTHCK